MTILGIVGLVMLWFVVACLLGIVIGRALRLGSAPSSRQFRLEDFRVGDEVEAVEWDWSVS